MGALRNRIEKLEGHPLLMARKGRPRTFTAQGPVGFDARAFLRECGHDVRDGDIVRVIVGCENAKPVDLPLADLTREFADGLH